MNMSLYLQRPEGRLAYDVRGEGPLVVGLPGMGDLRASYRFQVEPLVDAGFRVATLDLRGHGDSDATFSAYDDEAAAGDLVALVEHLGGPAVAIGNSMSAGAAVIAAARRPELFTGLVLSGPFVRNPPVNPVMAGLMRVLMAPPWARFVWAGYLPQLYKGRPPADFEAYRAQMAAAMKQPGRAAAFSRTTRTDHAPAEAALSGVRCPALVLMGALDPDFPDPRAEADWIAAHLGSGSGQTRVQLVDEAGHYPHAQRPDLVNPALVEFLLDVTARA